MQFLVAMRDRFPQHFALVVVLAYTGLRFCHASALRWEDWDDEHSVLHIRRKQVRGRIGKVTNKKRAPKEYPVESEVADILREHRRAMIKTTIRWYSDGLDVPIKRGHPEDAKHPAKRFTPNGLSYTFSDIIRRAKIDPVVRRALTGHVTVEQGTHKRVAKLETEREILKKFAAFCASENE